MNPMSLTWVKISKVLLQNTSIYPIMCSSIIALVLHFFNNNDT